MPKLAIKKTSQLLLTVLLVSMFVPVLAFAASYDVSFDGQTVTGSVYMEDHYGPEVEIAVYGPDGKTFLKNVTATLVTYVAGKGYQYKIDGIQVTEAVYSKIGLKTDEDETVHNAVYDASKPTWTNASVTATDVTSTSVTLTWSGASDTVGSVTYNVYNSTLRSYAVKLFSGNTYTITGLSPNTTYTFVIEAVDDAGQTAENNPSITVTTRSSGGYGGGGGGGISGPVDGKIETGSDGTVSADELRKELEAHSVVEITIKGDSAIIPASALADAANKDGAAIKLMNEHGTMTLPLNALDLEALAKAADVDIADLNIVVSIKPLSGDDAAKASDALAELGGKSLSAFVDFSVVADGGNGKKIPVDSFGNIYVKRTIPVTTKPSGNATVVMYDPATGKFTFVPGTVSDTEAEFQRTGTSVYTVIEYSKTFDDIADHWAKSYIELLAGKLIVDGVTDTAFEPDRNITRAEFAALVVRSLGLTADPAAASFTDVRSGDWFAGVVGAAAKAGIVEGYEDGTFRPNAPITREELAAMVVRAYEFADGKATIDDSSISQILAKWDDADRIVWGHREVALAVQIGLMNGMTDTTLATDRQATRAQSAAMLKRFLTEVGFINET